MKNYRIYTYFLVVLPVTVIVILPGLFGYVNVFLTRLWWVPTGWLLVGLIIRYVYLAYRMNKEKSVDKILKYEFFQAVSIVLLIIWVLLGYGVNYYGGDVSGGNQIYENCSFDKVYVTQGQGIVGGNTFVTGYFPGYMRVVPDSGRLRNEFEECR